jgi:hypothetical protein
LNELKSQIQLMARVYRSRAEAATGVTITTSRFRLSFKGQSEDHARRAKVV